MLARERKREREREREKGDERGRIERGYFTYKYVARMTWSGIESEIDSEIE